MALEAVAINKGFGGGSSTTKMERMCSGSVLTMVQSIEFKVRLGSFNGHVISLMG